MVSFVAELFLTVQTNSTSASDRNCEMYMAVDKLSSSRATAVTMEGYLNYKATHHEGKVSNLNVIYITLTPLEQQ